MDICHIWLPRDYYSLLELLTCYHNLGDKTPWTYICIKYFILNLNEWTSLQRDFSGKWTNFQALSFFHMLHFPLSTQRNIWPHGIWIDGSRGGGSLPHSLWEYKHTNGRGDTNTIDWCNITICYGYEGKPIGCCNMANRLRMQGIGCQW
jgi:hypothetical protein